MSSNRLRLLLVSVMAVFAISAVASASASATCYKVKVAGTGAWQDPNCAVAGPPNEYVKGTIVGPVAGEPGVWCAKVEPAKTGTYKNAACTEAEAKGEYIKVMENAAEQQQFKLPAPNGCSEKAGGQGSFETKATCEAGTPEKAGGKWHQHRGFTSKSGAGTLSVAGIKVKCQADTDKGEILDKESVTKVGVTFTGCKAVVTKEEKTNECAISSKGKLNAEEKIETVSLKGELGEIAAAESKTEVGLLLEPEAAKEEKAAEFVTLNATAAPCSTPETKVTGQIVGEVTPLALSLEDKLVFALNGGKQAIKTFERSLAKHCTGGPKCIEDGVFKPELKAFGLEATEETTDTNTFEEKVEVLKGV